MSLRARGRQGKARHYILDEQRKAKECKYILITAINKVAWQDMLSYNLNGIFVCDILERYSTLIKAPEILKPLRSL